MTEVQIHMAALELCRIRNVDPYDEVEINTVQGLMYYKLKTEPLVKVYEREIKRAFEANTAINFVLRHEKF
jgi:hypothetical protein